MQDDIVVGRVAVDLAPGHHDLLEMVFTSSFHDCPDVVDGLEHMAFMFGYL